jgi:hypothetical protein
MKTVSYLIVVTLLLVGTAYPQADTQPDLNGKIPAAVHEAHSHLFTQNLPVDSVKEGTTKVMGAGRGMLILPRIAPTMDQLLTRMVCSADAVALAVIGESESSITSDREGVFTDSLARIKTVLRDNPKRALPLNGVIVIGRPGGKVEVSPGTKVDVFVEDSPPFVKGNRYLIFLRYVPESEQYISTGDLFEVHGQEFRAVPPSPDVGRYDFSALTSIAEKVTCTESDRSGPPLW